MVNYIPSFLRHEKQLQELKVSHEAATQRLNEHMRELERENKSLKAQQESVLSAITSIMKPTHQVRSVDNP